MLTRLVTASATLFLLSATAPALAITSGVSQLDPTMHQVVSRPTLAASVPKLEGMRDLGRTSQTPVLLALTLAYRHDAELQQLITLQSEPGSRYYHQFLSNQQFADYFAPSALDQQRVVASLQRAGFRIAHTYANRTVVDAIAPAFVAERYFQTEIHNVVQSNHGLRYANVRPAIMPTEIRDAVSSVTGLNNVVYMHTALQGGTAQEKATAKARALELFGKNATSISGTRLSDFRGYIPASGIQLNATSNEIHDQGFESGRFGKRAQAPVLPILRSLVRERIPGGIRPLQGPRFRTVGKSKALPAFVNPSLFPRTAF